MISEEDENFLEYLTELNIYASQMFEVNLFYERALRISILPENNNSEIVYRKT